MHDAQLLWPPVRPLLLCASAVVVHCCSITSSEQQQQPFNSFLHRTSWVSWHQNSQKH